MASRLVWVRSRCAITFVRSGERRCSVMSLKEGGDRVASWSSRWQEGRTGFHMTEVNPRLLGNYSAWLGEGGTPCIVLVPLCGKSHDLKWLYDRGHTVIGVEAVEKAVKEFFEEHRLPHTVVDVEESDIKLYQTSDDRLRIYLGDLLEMDDSLLGTVDAVWDRGSLVAIYEQDRNRYGELLRSLMSTDCRYLLEAMEYDVTRFSGPPRHMPLDTVQKVLGGFCDITLLETIHASVESTDTSDRMRGQLQRFNLLELTTCTYLLTRARP